ncbi:unnamed protein product [Parajaminaea phylloscopi]
MVVALIARRGSVGVARRQIRARSSGEARYRATSAASRPHRAAPSASASPRTFRGRFQSQPTMGSDGHLHCNWLKCRKSLLLDGKAVVTTCNIFCVPCAEQLFTSDKTCPACKTVLDQPDDVVLSSLTPSADYRTVSGLEDGIPDGPQCDV